MMAHPVDKNDLTPYSEMKKVFEKSIVAITPLKKGQVLQRDMVGLKKPGGGLQASNLESVIGKRIVRDIEVDEQILQQDVE